MKDFRDLQVWQKAHQLALGVYRVTSTFPREEVYILTSQLRRGAASIASNIAEGCGRGSDADFRRFLQIAMGCACETEYQLLLARDLGFIEGEPHRELDARVTEVKRMLTGLIQKLTADG
jgi:four helix bundle protein